MVPALAAGTRDGGLGQRAQQHVDDALRGLDVAAGDGAGGRASTMLPSGGQRERAQDAGGGGRVFAEQAAQDVEAGGERDGADGVDAAGHLRRGAGEVDGDGSGARGVESELDAIGWESVTPSSSSQSSAVKARGHGAQLGADQALGVVEQLFDERLSLARRTSQPAQHALLADAAGADLRSRSPSRSSACGR
jgi:hypothetical protein